MASKITSKAPILRYLSKWIMVGGAGLIVLAFALMFVTSSLPANQCLVTGSHLATWCSEQDEQNSQIKDVLDRTVGLVMWLGIGVTIIAFIAWVNVRRW